MSSLRQEQISAASQFAETTLRLLAHEPSLHTETVIAANARMAGTFLFRSFAHALNDITPGTVLLSQPSSESGPNLIGLLSGALARLGITIDNAQVDLQVASAGKPRLDFLSSQRLLEPEFILIKQRFSLSYEEAAQAVAVATAMLIKQSEKSLRPAAAFGIAVYGFIEGSKTAPDPVKR